MPVVARLTQRSEPVPGVGVGYSAVNELAAGFGVVVGHCGWSTALDAEAVLGEVVPAGRLPAVSVAALSGGSSAAVADTSLFGAAVGARPWLDGAAAGGADAGGPCGHELVVLVLGAGSDRPNSEGLVLPDQPRHRGFRSSLSTVG